jgi:hypothetical protein
MEKLKILVLNAQDLFLFADKVSPINKELLNFPEIQWQMMSSSMFANKPKEKCQILAQTITDSQADIVMLTEIGGEESLRNFCKIFFPEDYFYQTMPSNSDRGIDMGYLIHKRLGFSMNLKSHIKYLLPQSSLKFSRDVLELRLILNKKIQIIFLLVHIKSKLNLKNVDFEGRTRRKLEILGLMDIYQKLKLKHPDIPIFIGGDFNGQASESNTEEEFLPISQQSDLVDCASLVEMEESERFSHLYFNRGGQVFKQQLDYLFLDRAFSGQLVKEETLFLRYKNLDGNPLPIPSRPEQKNLMPSDHFPLLVTYLWKIP